MGYLFSKTGGSFSIKSESGNIVYSGNHTLNFKVNDNKIDVIVNELGGSGNVSIVGSYSLSDIVSIGGEVVAGTLDLAIGQLNELLIDAVSLPTGGAAISASTPVNIASDQIVPIQLYNTANVDAFSRLRVSTPTSLFSIQCQYNESPLQMEGGNTGTGVAPTHNANSRMVALATNSGTGTSFFQSYEYIPYQAGKSHLVFITGVLGEALANSIVDVGYFDLLNGIIYRQNGTNGLELIRRTSTSGSVVDNTVPQSSWNLDKLDGTGASGINIDVNKCFILILDLQFLGMGRVRVGFDIGGNIIYAHEFLNANIIAVPYMQSATLPIQMLVTSTSSASAKTAYFKCASVNSEGGSADDFAITNTTPDVSVTAGNGTRTHLLSIRPKTTFNNIINRTLFEINEVSLLVTGNSPVFWELCVGQAITGTTTYIGVNTANSAYEYNTLGTISGSPYSVLASNYIPATAQSKSSSNYRLSNKYPISLNRVGAIRANGTLSLVVTGLGGTSAVRASISFTEVR